MQNVTCEGADIEDLAVRKFIDLTARTARDSRKELYIGRAAYNLKHSTYYLERTTNKSMRSS